MNWIEISSGCDGRRWINMDRALDIEQFRDGDRPEAVGRIRFGNDHYAYWMLYTQADMDRALQAILLPWARKEKADEPEPVQKFKAGDHVYVVGGETGDYIVQGVTLAKPRVHGKPVWICRVDGSTPESLNYDACESEMFRTESQAWMEVAARYEGERADAAQRCQDAQGKAAELRSA